MNIQARDSLARAGSPLIWVLLGEKKGDNSQAIAAARTLSLPFRKKRLYILEPYRTRPPLVRPSTCHVDFARSDPLEEPWPDLIITVGRRLSMAALWVKEQSNGKTKIVLLGAPKGCRNDFDLVVVPNFYLPTKARRELRIKLPLVCLDPHLLAIAKRQYGDTLGMLPKPLTVLLFGGPVGHMILNANAAVQILMKTYSICPQDGSLVVCTSRRTSRQIVEALTAALPHRAKLFVWSESESPYLGLVAHGDRFVVTGDSVSMPVEIARLRKQLAIAELKSRWPELVQQLWRWLSPAARDLGIFHTALYEQGLAVRLGAPFALPSSRLGPELDKVKSEICDVLGWPELAQEAQRIDQKRSDSVA